MDFARKILPKGAQKNTIVGKYDWKNSELLVSRNEVSYGDKTVESRLLNAYSVECEWGEEDTLLLFYRPDDRVLSIIQLKNETYKSQLQYLSKVKKKKGLRQIYVRGNRKLKVGEKAVFVGKNEFEMNEVNAFTVTATISKIPRVLVFNPTDGALKIIPMQNKGEDEGKFQTAMKVDESEKVETIDMNVIVGHYNWKGGRLIIENSTLNYKNVTKSISPLNEKALFVKGLMKKTWVMILNPEKGGIYIGSIAGRKKKN